MYTTLFIQNLKCNGCANTITNKLGSLHNVSNVIVNVEEGSVSFSYEDELALLNAKEALKINGYPEEGEDNSFGTKAKSFVSCAVGRMG